MDTLSTNPPRTSLPRTRRWHRRIAWVALLAACTFALTGLLHPLMSRLQPKPAQFAPPPIPQLAAALPAPATVLGGQGTIAGLRLLQQDARPLWRLQGVDGRVRYFDAETGALQPDDMERQHAERLARWYAGEATIAIAQAQPVTAFGAEYSYVSRLLPVWRVEFARDDGLTVFVSTEDDRLAAISDTRKRIFQQVFSAVHSWSWLPAPLRNSWINALLASVAFTVLMGLTLAVRTRGGQRWNLRRLHRWAGVAISLSVLGWVISGFVQARGNALREQADAPQRPLRAEVAQLLAPMMATGPASGLALVALGGKPVWRWSLRAPEPTTGRGLAMSEHQHGDKPPQGAAAAPAARYVSALDGQEIAGGEQRHLGELLSYFGVQASAAAAMPVLKFNPDYAFLFKRLPVWRFEQADADHTAVYLDTGSERLAATVSDGDRTAGALFAYAHKWEWVTPFGGKDARDVLGALFALSFVGVAIGGTLLRLRRR